jgi:hypothetical protein
MALLMGHKLAYRFENPLLPERFGSGVVLACK